MKVSGLLLTYVIGLIASISVAALIITILDFTGTAGANGRNGVNGRDARDGIDGIAGRDGVSPILPPYLLRSTAPTGSLYIDSSTIILGDSTCWSKTVTLTGNGMLAYVNPQRNYCFGGIGFMAVTSTGIIDTQLLDGFGAGSLMNVLGVSKYRGYIGNFIVISGTNDVNP